MFTVYCSRQFIVMRILQELWAGGGVRQLLNCC